MSNTLSARQISDKLEQYCAYQERCHQEVYSKLRSFTGDEHEINTVIVHLINNNYLNEERFARSFARGKHRIKGWGRNRIVSELKHRNISANNINLALKEIDDDDYAETFEKLALRQWESIRETDSLKKRKKFCDFLLRKGYDSAMVYDKARMFEKKHHK